MKNLLVEQKEREVKHKRNVEELIVNRKKTQIPDVPEIQKHVPAMLNNYRNSQIGNDSKPAEIKQLESKVEQARLESRRLDKEILVVHRKKDQIELEIKKMEMEIRQSEANCEGIRKQTAQIEENNRKELAEMERSIEKLQEEKQQLLRQLEEADYWKRVKKRAHFRTLA